MDIPARVLHRVADRCASLFFAVSLAKSPVFQLVDPAANLVIEGQRPGLWVFGIP